MKRIKGWVVFLVVIVLVLLTLSGILLWNLGLFEFTGENASTKIIATTLALVGGLITSVVTIVGIFLKNSIDQRNTELKEREERRLALEAERNANLRDEAEKRQRLDTAIQAIQLLDTSSGKNVTHTQVAGVLFTLTNLGQIDLAINLAGLMVDENIIDAETIDWLLNQALTSQEKETWEAGCALFEKVSLPLFIDEKDGLLRNRVPYCLCEYNQKLSLEAIRRGLQSLLEQLLSQPCSKWHAKATGAAIIILASFWTNLEEGLTKNSIGICLQELLKIEAMPSSTYTTISGNTINMDYLKQQLTHLNPNTQDCWVGYSELREKIAAWGTT